MVKFLSAGDTKAGVNDRLVGFHGVMGAVDRFPAAVENVEAGGKVHRHAHVVLDQPARLVKDEMATTRETTRRVVASLR